MAGRWWIGLAIVAGLAACGDDGPGVPGSASESAVMAGAAAGRVPESGPVVADHDEAPATGPRLSGPAGGDVVVDGGDGWSVLEVAAPVPATVAVVGDSLTESAVDEIETALSRLSVDQVIVDGLSRRRMARGDHDLSAGTEAIDAILELVSPDLWVIALGTNDVGAQVQPEMFRADAAAVLDAIPDGVPVVWVNVYIRWDDTLTSDANSIIADLVADRADSSVVDWAALAQADGLIAGDGVHLTIAGRLAFADAMADTVFDRALDSIGE